MKSLGDLAHGGAQRGASLERTDLEAALRINDADYFAGREGYDPDFIAEFPIALPTNSRKKDELQLTKGKGTVLDYTHFSAVMSKSRRLAFYVAANIDGGKSKRIKRDRDVWYLDGRIDLKYQVGEDMYTRNHLDRGHLVRREDPVWGGEAALANEDTFHFTNCAPQHEGMNQQTWLGLEDYILKNARAEKLKVSVFNGPVFRKDDMTYRGVQIPKEYWKVVAMRSEGRRSATAYMISQENLLTDLEFVFGKYKTYQVSIRRVEKLTGLKFGELSKYDGFSNEEAATGQELKVALESWEAIRV